MPDRWLCSGFGQLSLFVPTAVASSGGERLGPVEVHSGSLDQLGRDLEAIDTGLPNWRPGLILLRASSTRDSARHSATGRRQIYSRKPLHRPIEFARQSRSHKRATDTAAIPQRTRTFVEAKGKRGYGCVDWSRSMPRCGASGQARPLQMASWTLKSSVLRGLDLREWLRSWLTAPTGPRGLNADWSL